MAKYIVVVPDLWSSFSVTVSDSVARQCHGPRPRAVTVLVAHCHCCQCHGIGDVIDLVTFRIKLKNSAIKSQRHL